MSDGREDFDSELNETFWRDYLENIERQNQAHDKAMVAAFWKFKQPDRLI